MIPAADTTGILLDVEGTTTPISFVYETLFPYARKRLREACGKIGLPEIAQAIALLKKEWELEEDEGIRGEVDEFGDGSVYAGALMDRDRKSTGLKQLQGILWEEGYRSGELMGAVFEDVPRALRRWNYQKKRVRIYSSGSVLAQKLLFGFSEYGNLNEHLSGFYDTTVGPKKEAASYATIAADFGLKPSRILFLSDNLEELDAAWQAGLQTALCVRPGNSAVPPHNHPVIRDFEGLFG